MIDVHVWSWSPVGQGCEAHAADSEPKQGWRAELKMGALERWLRGQKRTCCTFKGSRFESHHLHGSLQPPTNSSARRSYVSRFCGHQAYTRGTWIYSDKILIIHKKLNWKHFKDVQWEAIESSCRKIEWGLEAFLLSVAAEQGTCEGRTSQLASGLCLLIPCEKASAMSMENKHGREQYRQNTCTQESSLSTY